MKAEFVAMACHNWISLGTRGFSRYSLQKLDFDSMLTIDRYNIDKHKPSIAKEKTSLRCPACQIRHPWTLFMRLVGSQSVEYNISATICLNL